MHCYCAFPLCHKKKFQAYYLFGVGFKEEEIKEKRQCWITWNDVLVLWNWHMFQAEFFTNCFCGGLWDSLSTPSYYNTCNAHDTRVIFGLENNSQTLPGLWNCRIILNDFLSNELKQASFSWLGWEVSKGFLLVDIRCGKNSSLPLPPLPVEGRIHSCPMLLLKKVSLIHFLPQYL